MPNGVNNSGNDRKYVAVIIAALAAASLFFIPLAEPGMTDDVAFTGETRNLAVIFLITLSLWATETIPIAVTALLAIVLQPLLGVTGVREALGKGLGLGL